MCEAAKEHCASQSKTPRKRKEKDHAGIMFTRLMLCGQMCSSVRFIADRVSGGGVLSANYPSDVPGLSVLDVLKQKHPEPSKVVPSTIWHKIF